MKKQLAVGGAIAVALAFAAAPAFAIGEAPAPSVRDVPAYVTDPPVNVTPPVITPCEQSSILFGAGYFAGGETVGIGVSGVNAANANVPASVTANGDGSATILFTPPAGGSGPYTLSFASASAEYQTVITVDTSAEALASCQQGPDTELPLTPGTTNPPTELPLTSSAGGTGGPMELPLTGGGGFDPLLLGIGGGAIVLGASLAVIGATRGRRNKA